jgi:hypothetical protein
MKACGNPEDQISKATNFPCTGFVICEFLKQLFIIQGYKERQPFSILL